MQKRDRYALMLIALRLDSGAPSLLVLFRCHCCLFSEAFTWASLTKQQYALNWNNSRHSSIDCCLCARKIDWTRSLLTQPTVESRSCKSFAIEREKKRSLCFEFEWNFPPHRASVAHNEDVIHLTYSSIGVKSISARFPDIGHYTRTVGQWQQSLSSKQPQCLLISDCWT